MEGKYYGRFNRKSIKLNSMVDKIMKDHQDEIAEALFTGGTDEMSKEKVIAIMMMNCLSLSMKLSVQVVFELLQSQGVLQIDEHEIAKLYLKHLSSEKEE